MTPLDHDETTLYTALRKASSSAQGRCAQALTLGVASRLGMRTVRLDELLAAWARAGWWEDGQEWFAGCFTGGAPLTIDEIEQVVA
jgi:hypothetical protein